MNVRGVFVVGSLVAGTFVPALGAVSPANASVPAAGTLQAVSCVSGGFCVAVGRSDTGGEHPRIEQWDGTKWSLAATPAGPAGVLSGVSCVSAVDCTAVGGPTPGPVAEHWNGSTWSRQATPRGSDSYYDDLRAVSCSSATTCIAVGFTDTNNRGYAPLAERWNGASWKITPTPNPSGSGDTRLAGVTCVSATDCFAAGYSSPLKHDQALLLHWDGRAWSNHTLPAPSAASDTSFLNAIQCVHAEQLHRGRFVRSRRQREQARAARSWNIGTEAHGRSRRARILGQRTTRSSAFPVLLLAAALSDSPTARP